jgi:hypothetical protein
MGHQAIAGPVAAVLQFLDVIDGFQFYRGRPTVFVNLKQVVTVPSNTTTFLKFRNDYTFFLSKKTIIRP